jgi:hypothetical protein
MRDAFIAGGGVLTRSRFRKFARFGDDVYAKRWGGWSNVLLHFKEWVEETEPTFPHLADLPSRLRASTLRARSEAQPALPGTPRRPPATTAWKPTGRAQYGPFLNFRGLQHAPINEQGVIYLFGIVAFDLGYVVEGIGTGFPDCEAKRSVRASGDAWERVRIEFEYRSRNFLVHGHDAAECDVLVCWEHNWPDCPLEVLELRSAIESFGRVVRPSSQIEAGMEATGSVSKPGLPWITRRRARALRPRSGRRQPSRGRRPRATACLRTSRRARSPRGSPW